MLKTHPLSFLRVRRAEELPPGWQRAAFYGAQALFLLLSAALVSLLSLCLAFGNYDWGVFMGYLHVPSILLLNTLPVLLLELLLLCLFNRHWAAVLGTALVILLPSVGNYFKIKLRFEPFVFRDVGVIGDGLKIAREYSLSLNHRLWLVIALSLLCLLFARLCIHGRLPGRARAAGLVLVLAALFPLWRFVYSDSALYLKYTRAISYLGNLTPQQDFISAGFVYPFLFSITDRQDIVPEGYDEAEAAAAIAAFSDADMPAGKRVNLLVIQLESFTDLEAKGLREVDPAVYAPWRLLQAESLHGVMIANVIGGGTIDTERCLLTGSYGIQTYTRNAPSYVRYLRSQGYRTVGCHPNRPDFYNRVNVNRYLGLEHYDFIGVEGSPVTKAWMSDAVFLPEVFRAFRDQIRDEAPIFSFNVSYQGHSPYNAAGLNSATIYWPGEGVSDTTRNVINNYLGSVAETQALLLAQLDTLRDLDEPVLVLVYGDHNPYLYSATVYQEAGLRLDLSDAAGIEAYYGTPYLLWANDAARPLLASELRGTGPTISPGYFMNLIFERLGLPGSAFMQFTETIRSTLPVVNSQGYVMGNGVLTSAASEEALALLHNYTCVQFYLRDSY